MGTPTLGWCQSASTPAIVDGSPGVRMVPEEVTKNFKAAMEEARTGSLIDVEIMGLGFFKLNSLILCFENQCCAEK